MEKEITSKTRGFVKGEFATIIQYSTNEKETIGKKYHCFFNDINKLIKCIEKESLGYKVQLETTLYEYNKEGKIVKKIFSPFERRKEITTYDYSPTGKTMILEEEFIDNKIKHSIKKIYDTKDIEIYNEEYDYILKTKAITKKDSEICYDLERDIIIYEKKKDYKNICKIDNNGNVICSKEVYEDGEIINDISQYDDWWNTLYRRYEDDSWEKWEYNENKTRVSYENSDGDKVLKIYDKEKDILYIENDSGWLENRYNDTGNIIYTKYDTGMCIEYQYDELENFIHIQRPKEE